MQEPRTLKNASIVETREKSYWIQADCIVNDREQKTLRFWVAKSQAMVDGDHITLAKRIVAEKGQDIAEWENKRLDEGKRKRYTNTTMPIAAVGSPFRFMHAPHVAAMVLIAPAAFKKESSIPTASVPSWSYSAQECSGSTKQSPGASGSAGDFIGMGGRAGSGDSPLRKARLTGPSSSCRVKGLGI